MVFKILGEPTKGKIKEYDEADDEAEAKRLLAKLKAKHGFRLWIKPVAA